MFEFDEVVKTPMHVMLRGKHQCLLRSDNWITVKWISIREAKTGNTIKFSNDNLTWTIFEVYN